METPEEYRKRLEEYRRKNPQRQGWNHRDFILTDREKDPNWEDD